MFKYSLVYLKTSITILEKLLNELQNRFKTDISLQICSFLCIENLKINVLNIDF